MAAYFWGMECVVCWYCLTIKGINGSSYAFNGRPCCIPKYSVAIMKAMVGAEGWIVWEHVF